MAFNCKNVGCPKEKKICCFFCEEVDTCGAACLDALELEEPSTCPDADMSVVPNERERFMMENARALKTITSILVDQKKQEAKLKSMREAIQSSMEKHEIVKFETDDIIITYKQASTRKTFDSTRFKKDHPEMAEEYQKVSNVKASIMVKVKE